MRTVSQMFDEAIRTRDVAILSGHDLNHVCFKVTLEERARLQAALHDIEIDQIAGLRLVDVEA